MSRQSYSTPLTSVGADIDVVGGKNSVLGDIREDLSGNKFLLVVAGGTIAAKDLLRIVGGDYTVLSNNTSTGIAMGFSLVAAVDGQYFWAQISGIAVGRGNGSAGAGELAVAATSATVKGIGISTDLGDPKRYFTIGVVFSGDGGVSGADVKVLISPSTVWQEA